MVSKKRKFSLFSDVLGVLWYALLCVSFDADDDDGDDDSDDNYDTVNQNLSILSSSSGDCAEAHLQGQREEG